MPVPSARLKNLTEGRLDFHASQRWPPLEEVTISWRGGYGYVSAYLSEDEAIPICRLHYLGTDTDWDFAIYRASSQDYHDTQLPDGATTATPAQILDHALGLYLADSTTPVKPPKD